MRVRFLRLEIQCGCAEGRVWSVEARRAASGPKRTRIPNFEGLVVRPGNDRLSVGREGHGADVIAVGVALLCHELQCGCEGGRASQLKEDTSGFGLNARLNSRL